MSVSLKGMEEGVFSNFDSSIDRQSLSESSFVAWFETKLRGSFLNPLSYRIRPIEDRGSISESLRQSKIDLFDRERVPINRLIKIVGIVVRTLILTLISPIFGLLGACYHGYTLSKYVIFQILKKEKIDPQKFSLHKSLIITDIIASSPILGLGIGLPLEKVLGMASCIGLAISLESTVSAGQFKSRILREEFGIVSKQTGECLNWNPAVDEDDVDVFLYSYRVRGYFGTLYEKQSEKLLNEIKALQATLSQNCKMPFFYPPNSEKINLFLDENRASTGLSDFEIEEWKRKFSIIDENIRLVFFIISSTSYYSKYHLIRGFPFSEEKCKSYFN